MTEDVAHVLISLSEETPRMPQVLQALNALRGSSVPISLIKLHRSAVALAFPGAAIDRAEQALQAADKRFRIRRDLAIVAVEAPTMRDLSGVMVHIADALYEAGARLIAVGDSYNSVQCLIEARMAEAAVTSLLDRFSLRESAVHPGRIEKATGQ